MLDIHPASMLGIMFILHFFADFNLQIGACLDKFKQKRWWDDKIYDSESIESRSVLKERYGNDYKCAMACHALYWSLVVCLPLVLVGGSAYLANSLIQGACHYLIDDMKANKMKLNLIEDQIIHAAQIFGVWGVWMALK